MPKNNKEIVLSEDSLILRNKKIGDTITFNVGKRVTSEGDSLTGPGISDDEKLIDTHKEEYKIMLFGTKTCPNCKVAKTLLDKKHIKYEFVDAEEDVDLTKKYNVKQAPTLVVIKNGVATNVVNLSNIKKFTEEA